jgi:2-polyprenyl-3-methyl-5-hydroxy-6-metoxy-1,4-benzoquinol methylase
MAKKQNIRSTFDEAYYRRFYDNPRSAVISRADVERLAKFVLHYLAYLHISVRSVLDVGCGVGLWRDVLRSYDRNITYKGLEVSQYVCDKYGWTRGSILDFTSRRKYDLVVCQGVLPYLNETDVGAALRNLHKLVRGALYLEAVTKEDRKNGVIDMDKTDGRIYLRGAKWYRKRISRYFIGCGGGLFFPLDTHAALFELEKI